MLNEKSPFSSAKTTGGSADSIAEAASPVPVGATQHYPPRSFDEVDSPLAFFPLKKSRTAFAEVPTAMTAFFSSISEQANLWHQNFISLRSWGLTLSLAKGRRLDFSALMFPSF
jgi:hypothetical protein